MRQRSSGWIAFTLPLCGFYLVWTLWAILLTRYPSLDRWPVRLGIRIAVWGGVAVLYLVADKNWIRDIRLTRGAVLWGLAASSFCIARLVWRCAQKDSIPLMPDNGTIANAIIAGPILEELLFRGIVFRELVAKLNVLVAAIISAGLFAAIHLPYWWLAHTMPPREILLAAAGVFFLGIVLALIYRASGSLVAPVILHVLNNLTSLAAP